MNIHSTDIDRDFAEIPNDPAATKENREMAIISYFSALSLGVLLGVIGVMGYFAIVGKPCSAAPYCTEHKVK